LRLRGYFLVALLLAAIPFAISMPFAGVLLWSWLSFMSPHRDTYTFVYDAPLVLVVALATLAAWFLSPKPKQIVFERTSVAMLIFVFWTALTTVTAINPNYSAPSFVESLKTFLLAFAVLEIINSKTRIQSFVWVIAISIGYYAAKGAGFTLMTGGLFRVHGPDGTAISDNNNLGAALVLSLPLLNYLRLSSRHFIVSIGVILIMGATAIACIGTYSRGGLFGLGVVAAVMWLRSRHKSLLTGIVAALLIALPTLVPAQWYQRMSTISTYSEDESFEQRLGAWNVSTQLAIHRPLTGGGFNATQIDSVYNEFGNTVGPGTGRAAHSIYFEVLGDHGFAGLALYVVMLIIAFLNIQDTLAQTKERPDLRWLADLTAMTQVALIGFLSAGALLSMAYYDVFIVLVALTGRLRLLAVEAKQAAAPQQLLPWLKEPTPAS